MRSDRAESRPTSLQPAKVGPALCVDSLTSRRFATGLCALLVAIVCVQTYRVQAERPPAPPMAVPLSTPDRESRTDWPIDAVHRISDRLTSGALPATREQLEFLKSQGYDTVVSVDGTPPNIELAQQVGLRYIHIPLRYSGIEKDAQEALTRVVRDVPGKIFVHCHHGRHRGPAAAVICAIADGALTHAQARQFLEDAGTSPHYTGLWRDVAAYRPPAADAVLPKLRSVAPVDPLASVMVRIDHNAEAVQAMLSMADSQEFDASRLAAQALLLQEEFAEAARLRPHADGDSRDAELVRELKRGSELAATLRSVLATDDLESARDLWAVIKGQCRACHHEHRDR